MSEQNIIDYLTSIGIKDVGEVVYNPSYDQLYEEETGQGLQGFEKRVSNGTRCCQRFHRRVYRALPQRQVHREG